MQKFFEQIFTVRSYEVDAEGRLKLSSVLRLMQETAAGHLNDDGLTYDAMCAQGVVFLLTRVALCIQRLPGRDEMVRVKTWFVETKGAHYLREMRFYDENGETLIEAITLWVTVNPQTHKIIRPDKVVFSTPEQHDDRVAVEAGRIVPPAQSVPVGSRMVVYSDIDGNRHMNNAVYADIVCDYFPGGFGGREVTFFQLDFLGEALPGETIFLSAGTAKDGMVIVTGNTGTHRCFEAAVGLRNE